MYEYLFLFIVFLILIIYNKYKTKYSIQTKSITLQDFSQKLNYSNKHVNFNPCVFLVNNETYIFWRVAYGEIFNPVKTYTDWSGKMNNYPSYIAITYKNKIIKCNTSHIAHYYPQYRNIKYRLHGYEDPRCVVLNDYLYVFVATFANSAKYPQIGFFKINKNELTKDQINCNSFILLTPGLNETTYQKNWMPLVNNDEIYLIYSIQPFIVYNCDKNTGDIQKHTNKDYNLKNVIRGGTPCINWYSEKYGDIFLCVAHIRRGMYYTHIFIGLTPEKLVCISDEFIFCNDNIKFVSLNNYCKYFINVQFAAGCIIKDDDLYITYGSGNVRGVMCRLEVNMLNTVMKKI